MPRSSHAEFAPADHRPDPIGLLEEQAASRVPELVPIRYGRMLVLPFTFYRGAALIMAADLAATPSSGLQVQLCGDAHLSNFGLFGSPERRLVFDLNDFDETLPGPFEWDVKRLAASLSVVGRNNGYSDGERRRTVLAAAEAYRTAMATFAGMSNLDVWYARLDVEEVLPQVEADLDRRRAKTLRANLAQGQDPRQRPGAGQVHPPAGWGAADRQPAAVDRAAPGAATRGRSRGADRGAGGAAAPLRCHPAARPPSPAGPVPSGRVGPQSRRRGQRRHRAWIALLVGRDGGDPLFLQMKEAQASVLERFLGTSRYHNHGQRVVAGQRLMQAASDIFLDWQRLTGLDGQDREFYLRQLRD